MKILIKKIVTFIKDFFLFVWETINDAGNIAFGGLMAIIWAFIQPFFELETITTIALTACVVLLAFIIAVFRKYQSEKVSRLKTETALQELKSRMPQYNFTYKLVKITNHFESSLITEFSSSQSPQQNIGSAWLSNISNLLHQGESREDKLKNFIQDVIAFNQIVDGGLFVLYLFFENIGKKSDSEIELNITIQGGKFINLVIPDEDYVNKDGGGHLFSAFHPVPNIILDGDLDIKNETEIEFWFKHTVQAEKIELLPASKPPIYIQSNQEQVVLTYSIVSKELPQQQKGEILIDLIQAEPSTYKFASDPLQLYPKDD